MKSKAIWMVLLGGLVAYERDAIYIYGLPREAWERSERIIRDRRSRSTDAEREAAKLPVNPVGRASQQKSANP